MFSVKGWMKRFVAIAFVKIVFASACFASDQPGKNLVWSKNIYLNAMNSIVATGESLGYMVGDSGLVYRTTNRGGHWEKVSVPTTERISYVNAGGAGQAILKIFHAYILSFDGKNWETTKLQSEEELSSGEFAPSQPLTAWIVTTLEGKGPNGAGGSVRLRVTADGGKTWKTYGQKTHVQLDFFPDIVRPITDDRAWARAGDTVYLTEDAGKSWRLGARLAFQSGESAIRSIAAPTSLLVVTNKGHIFEVFGTGQVARLPDINVARVFNVGVLSGSSTYMLDGSGQILKTDDIRGGKWDRIAAAEVSLSDAWAWPDGSYLFKATSGEIRVASAPWKKESVAFDVPAALQHAVATNGGRAIASTSAGELLASSDRGQTWEVRRKDDTGLIGALALRESGIAAAINGDGRLLYSSDFGVSWREGAQFPGRQRALRLILPGDSTAVAVTESGTFPLQRSNLFRVRLPDGPVESIDLDGSIVLLASTPSGSLRAVTDKSELLTSEGVDWPKAGTVTGPDNSPIDSTKLKSMWWMDEKHGWIAGTNNALLATDDGGQSFRSLPLPADHCDIYSVWFADSANGMVYGYDSDASTEMRALTSDGGATWTRVGPIGDGDAAELSMTHDGAGIFINSKGLTYVERADTAPAMSAFVEESLLGELTVRVERQSSPLLRKEDLKDVRLAIQLSEGGRWLYQRIDNARISNDNKGVMFNWQPDDNKQSDIHIPQGAKVNLHVIATLNNEVVQTFAIPRFTHLEWFATNRDWIVKVAWTLATLAAFALTLIGIYRFSPFTIINLYRGQKALAALISTALPGNLNGIFETLLLSPLVKALVKTDRVANAWCQRYAAEGIGFEALGDEVMEMYLRRTNVIDAWVARRFDSVRKHLDTQRQLLGAPNYIPLPIVVRDGEAAHNIERVTVAKMRDFFLPERVAFGLVGEGGIGKTTLALQLALWAMRSDPNERLLFSGAALAVVLYGKVENVLKEIGDVLRKASTDSDPLGTDNRILEAALKTRRLVVVVDGLSESDPVTLERFMDVFAELPIRVLIVTSRRPHPEILERWIEATPTQITASTVNHFVSEYLRQLGAARSISPEHELKISARIVSLVRRRFGGSSIPPLFITLVIDGILNGDQDVMDSTSLPQTVQRYVRALVHGDGVKVEKEAFAEAATKMAVLSLQDILVPQEFHRSLAISAIGTDDADDIVGSMIETQLLLERIGPDGPLLRFRLDPVAEYLWAAEITRGKTSKADLESSVEGLISKEGVRLIAPSLAETIASMRPRSAWRDALVARLQGLGGEENISAEDTDELSTRLNRQDADAPKAELIDQ